MTPPSCASNVEDLLTKNVDAVIISGGPLESAPAVLNSLKAAGKPVVLVDRKFPGEYTSWIGPDNEAIGRQNGEFLPTALPDGGKVAIIKGGPADNTIGSARTNGVKSVLSANPKFTLVEAPRLRRLGLRRRADRHGEPARRATRTSRRCSRENDAMCLGAQRAIADAGLADGIDHHAGVDGQAEALKAILDGTNYKVTGLNDADIIGAKGLDRAVEILGGATVEKDTVVPSRWSPRTTPPSSRTRTAASDPLPITPPGWRAAPPPSFPRRGFGCVHETEPHAERRWRCSLASSALTLTSTPAQADDPTRPGWTLLYNENFVNPINTGNAPWVRDDYSQPFDTIMDDPGQWYRNDYGPAWTTALNSFYTYRKEFPVGQNGWLTASLSARDWNKDGNIEQPPTLTTQTLGSEKVAVMNVPDHTGGVILRPTQKLPDYYRIEYKLKTLDFGGKRNGSIEYNGRTNGYSNTGRKTQHPWGEGENSPGWSGNPSAPYCEWQDVRRGTYGYNGFHFLSIVDFANPAPRNNHFWHYRRKVLMDAFSQHPDRVGSGTGGRVCNAADNTYYNYRDGNFNTVNMWISGMPNWNPGAGGLAGNSQWFMTPCSGGVAEQQLSSAAELQPELMPNQFYTFAIERDPTGYVPGGDRQLRPLGPADDPHAPPVRRQQQPDLALQRQGQRVQRPVQRQPGAERQQRLHDVVEPVARRIGLPRLLRDR